MHAHTELFDCFLSYIYSRTVVFLTIVGAFLLLPETMEPGFVAGSPGPPGEESYPALMEASCMASQPIGRWESCALACLTEPADLFTS